MGINCPLYSCLICKIYILFLMVTYGYVFNSNYIIHCYLLLSYLYFLVLVSFQGQRRHSVRVRVYHVWLFNLSEATTGPHKANADIQCACITSYSSFCPGQRQTSQGQREHSVRVRVTASTEKTVLFILSKTATGLSGSTRTFPCVCATPHL
jgi:hypothetical protein